MKKILVFLILLLPINVLAYSDYIIPGGETLGIDINTDGVMVIGFYQVKSGYINKQLQIGDHIIKVNDQDIYSVTDLIDAIASNIEDNKVRITYTRDNEEYNDYLNLSYENNNYKTGLYVKGNIAGIGTLSYVDSESGIYAILGHIINESKSNKKIDVRDGFAYMANVTSFSRSIDGSPGSKNASILKNEKFGSILVNTDYGVFGKVLEVPQKEKLKVGNIDDVKLGDATIYTTNDSNEVEEYKIKLIEVDKSHKTKNFYFEITDDKLLEMSGGIVQGMSGSPIIQDNKIIGVVTRVVVDDVKRGYGINIITMLEEGDKLK